MAGYNFALPAVVDVRGVEEGNPRFDRSTHDRLGNVLIQGPFATLVLAVAHHPEAEARDAKAGGAQIHVSHRTHATRSPAAPSVDSEQSDEGVRGVRLDVSQARCFR
jgi:hypothetical protein